MTAIRIFTTFDTLYQKRSHTTLGILKELTIYKDDVEVVWTRRLSYFGQVSLWTAVDVLLHGQVHSIQRQAGLKKRRMDYIKEDCDLRDLHSLPEADSLAKNRCIVEHYCRSPRRQSCRCEFTR